MTGSPSRLGFCCIVIPDAPPGGYPTRKAEREAVQAMNLTTTTMTYLTGLTPAARHAKLETIVRHNLAALGRQIDWVAARPAPERLLRIASSLLPGFTHPIARDLYAEPSLRRLIEAGLARLGERARAAGIRLSMHPGQFCLIASRNPSAQENGIAELEYHAEAMAMLGYDSGWHPHGAHINIHVGGREPGIDGFRAGLKLISQTARNLLTAENDETCHGLGNVLQLADDVPVVLDLHHHWVESGGEYIEPDDPRILRIRDSWRGVRPLSHISVSREDLLDGHDPTVLPDFAALAEGGHSRRDLAAHSYLMWNSGINALVARHLAWSDFAVFWRKRHKRSEPFAATLSGMKNEHVLSGLVRKRAEIAGQIEHTQLELRKLVTDLDAIDAAIRIFDPDADTGAIPSRQYPPQHAAFRGEMMRFVLGALRVATGPVTSREIADTIMEGRGLNKDDYKVVQMIRKRTGACMNKLKTRGLVREAAIEGELKGCVRN